MSRAPKAVFTFQIAKLALAPGDTLVARAYGRLSEAEAFTLRQYLETVRPEGVHVLIVDASVELSVLTKGNGK